MPVDTYNTGWIGGLVWAEPGIHRLAVLMRHLSVSSAVIVLASIVACSNRGPSEPVIENLVRADLDVLVPASLIRPLNSEDFEGMQSGKDAMIEGIRVLSVSHVKSKYPYYEYWLVKAYVEGRCTMIYSEVEREFAGEMEYEIYRNSVGQWALR